MYTSPENLSDLSEWMWNQLHWIFPTNMVEFPPHTPQSTQANKYI